MQWRSCALTAVEPFEPGFDHGNLFVDLTDRQADIVTRPSPEIGGQSLPEIARRSGTGNWDIFR
jgi:hypothetical protein